MPHFIRRLLIVFSIILAILCLAAVVFVRFWLDPYLAEKLIESTAQSSKDLYALHLDRLHVNIFTGSAEADDLHLSTDSTRWEAIQQETTGDAPLKIDLHIRRLRIKNLGWIHFLRTKNLDLKGIQIVDPQAELVSVKDTSREERPQTDSMNQGMLDRLPLLIAPFANQIHIGYIAVSNGKISFRKLIRNQSAFQQADSINGVLNNVHLIANDTSRNGKALFSDYLLLTVRNYDAFPAGNVYGYHVKSATIDGQHDQANLEEVSIFPKISDEAFMARLTIREPRLKVYMDKVKIRKLDLFRMLHQQEWDMESVAVEGSRINVYQNKNLPLNTHKRMPHELFRKIENYLNIDTILVRNMHILYTELMGDGQGQLEFNRTNGVLLNISNDTLKMSDTTPARLDVRTELLGDGILDLSLQIPLLSKTFCCSYTANLGGIDMTNLNRFVADKNNLRVESGMAEKIYLKVQVNDGLAKGRLEATYNNLKISILRKEDGSKRKVVSVIANVLIRGKNERGSEDHPFKIGPILYQREGGDGILRFVWRTAQTGLLATLVPNNIKLKKQPE